MSLTSCCSACLCSPVCLFLYAPFCHGAITIEACIYCPHVSAGMELVPAGRFTDPVRHRLAESAARRPLLYNDRRSVCVGTSARCRRRQLWRHLH